ncbi:MAG: glycosyltransferase 87 family protein [Chloroflexota bacterium]
MMKRRMLIRGAQAVAIGLVVGFALAALTGPGTNWWLKDADAYWNAALRLRAGEPLYPPLASVEDPEIYRYSPWFAFLWVPLTFLPQDLVRVVWAAVLLGGVALCIWPALRTRTLAGTLLSVLLGAILIRTASSGNVQPLMLAGLVLGVERRTGPLWIAVAASLKAVPLLYVAVYVARREWGRVAWTLVITAALVLPLLLFDLSQYPLDSGSLVDAPISAPWSWLVIAGLLYIVWRLRNGPLAWVAASAAVIIALPRWVPYFPSFTLVGSGTPPSPVTSRAEPRPDE